ncbi:Uncharacterized protein TCM_001003 [Theobroma cacao]|uniref:Uncharacterized protein n=1 Tax=Theobroma cacao TaxID=3641 RepID=A0A061DJ57_THECC|nr:Uncharacterized protein TCM_001003 [Theobroma cacao]
MGRLMNCKLFDSFGPSESGLGCYVRSLIQFISVHIYHCQSPFSLVALAPCLQSRNAELPCVPKFGQNGVTRTGSRS